MSISMYGSSVGVYTHMLRTLNVILDKAEKWATEKKIEPTALLHARLSPDMFHLLRQVQITTDMAKGTAARLAGEEPPRYEDNEATFADLKARVAKTIAYLETLKAEKFVGSETRQITLKMGPPTAQKVFEFVGLDYLQGFGTPNVFFHYSMVYALLRHNGLEIGKGDYMGQR
jgi:uncharacterized protein